MPSGSLWPGLVASAFPPSIEPRSLDIHKSALHLNSVIASALGAADSFWRNSPYLAAALTCGFKASAADYVAQRRQATEESGNNISISNSDTKVVESGGNVALAVQSPARIDLRRNLAFIIYGSIYQGMAQEYIYNHLYPAFFGSGTDVVTVLTKVLFDLLVQTTLITLPIAYISKALIYRYSFGEALERYVNDIRKEGLLTKYFALWGPVQCITFSIIPEHFRMTFIALVSFFWLIILSTIASRTPNPIKQAQQGDK
jgi:hypothetical protein